MPVKAGQAKISFVSASPNVILGHAASDNENSCAESLTSADALGTSTLKDGRIEQFIKFRKGRRHASRARNPVPELAQPLASEVYRTTVPRLP